MVEWNVAKPGGPSGPFHSIVASTGQVIAMQVPDHKIAIRIARIPHDDRQDARLVANLREIRENVLAGNMESVAKDLNFWISVYGE